MKTAHPVVASNGTPYLQMMSVRLHSMSGREKEVTKEGKDGEGDSVWSIGK